MMNPFIDDLKSTKFIELKDGLYNIIKERVWIKSDKPFKLASGITSSEYFNIKNLGSDGLALAAALLYKMIQKTDTASIGGLESGAIPLSVATSCMSLAQRSTAPLEWFYVRKDIKGHGTGNTIEGRPEPPVMILDDVITSGGSSLKAIRAIKDQNIDYIGTMCVLFRGEKEHKMALEEEGSFQYIFSHNDFQ